MKTHYFPWDFEDSYADQALCGTIFGELVRISANWDRVTCGHCLRNKAKIMSGIESDEKAIVEQMGQFAEFMQREAAE